MTGRPPPVDRGGGRSLLLPERRIATTVSLDGEGGEFKQGGHVADDIPDVVILNEPIAPNVLRSLVDRFFEDMVKYVVDLERGVVAIGGELHSDAGALLLEDGSRQGDLWGANYYPGRGSDECIEFTSLINIRPAEGNRSMELQDEDLRGQVRQLTFELIGRGEPLP